MRIVKKTWPKYFRLMAQGLKNVDVRLADFDISVGDEIHFLEFDPETGKYTGRKIIRQVVRLNKVDLTQFHSLKEIKEKGHWIIEVEQK